MKKSVLPNVMTALRIILSVPLLFAGQGTVLFYVLYSVVCLSDVLDGYFARKFHAATDFGAAFDTAADMVFFGVLFWRMITSVGLHLHEEIAVGVILTVKIINILLGYRLYRRFVALHTAANRVTGVLFVIAGFTMLPVTVTLTVLSALFASVQEGYLILHKRL